MKVHHKSHENDRKLAYNKFVGKVSNADIDLINKEIYSYSFDASDIRKIKEKINEEDSDFESEVNNRDMPKRKCVRDITTEKC